MKKFNYCFIDQHFRPEWTGIMMIRQKIGRYVSILNKLNLLSLFSKSNEIFCLSLLYLLVSVWFVLENMWSGKWLGPTFFLLYRKAKLLSMQQMWHGLWLTCLTEVSPSTTRGMCTICLQINLFAEIKKLNIWVNIFSLQLAEQDKTTKQRWSADCTKTHRR